MARPNPKDAGSLKAALDPERIFRQGEAFMEAAAILLHYSRPENQAMLGSPIVVNSAFASEVLLKCIIFMESGQTPRGHHLDKLFSSLSPKTRNEVVKIWNEGSARKEVVALKVEAAMGIIIPRDLQTCLLEGSKSFEQTRYRYEGDGKFRYMLGDLPKILHAVILARQPGWNVPLPPSRPLEAMQFSKPPM